LTCILATNLGYTTPQKTDTVEVKDLQKKYREQENSNNRECEERTREKNHKATEERYKEKQKKNCVKFSQGKINYQIKPNPTRCEALDESDSSPPNLSTAPSQCGTPVSPLL